MLGAYPKEKGFSGELHWLKRLPQLAEDISSPTL
jgi:hypothetical protein